MGTDDEGTLITSLDTQLRRYIARHIWATADRAVELDDLIQQAWVKGLPGLRSGTFPNEKVMVQYLARIVYNLATDLHRKHRAHAVLPLADWYPTEDSVSEQACLNVMAEQVAPTAHPVLIYQGLGYSTEEIAALTDTKANTVKTQAFRWRHANVTQPQLGV